MAVKHDEGCRWNPETEHCTCGALVVVKAYRFHHGGVIAFDQFGKQLPYYQAWDGVGAARIAEDFPHIEIKPGERV